MRVQAANFTAGFGNASHAVQPALQYLGIALHIVEQSRVQGGITATAEVDMGVEEFFNIHMLRRHCANLTPATWVNFQWTSLQNISSTDQGIIRQVVIQL